MLCCATQATYIVFNLQSNGWAENPDFVRARTEPTGDQEEKFADFYKTSIVSKNTYCPFNIYILAGLIQVQYICVAV